MVSHIVTREFVDCRAAKILRALVTKPYQFIGFGAMEVTKPYQFIGFGAMEVTKPYKFIGFWAGLGSTDRVCGSTLNFLHEDPPNPPAATPQDPWCSALTCGPIVHAGPGSRGSRGNPSSTPAPPRSRFTPFPSSMVALLLGPTMGPR